MSCKWSAVAVALWIALPARAEEHYVAPTGDDANPGTLDHPFATVERAQMAAAPGDTVWIRGGEYRFSGTSRTVGVAFTKSGSPGQPIRYFAYADERPVFDLFDLRPQARVTGLDVHCDWIHVRGLEVRGVRQIVVGDSWGVRIRGDDNVIENVEVHDNEAPGVFITSGADNLVLNCDSHHNYDPLERGDNADGFGCHSTGQGNVLRGCRAWENSDDGFDFINAAGACTVEHSWAFRNGFIPDTDMIGANGAGFKSGGYGYPPNTPATGAAHHVVRFNVAFGNRAIGFYANYHPGGIDFMNNTAFDNPSNFDMRTPGTPSSHTLRNNVAAGSGHAIVSFDGGTDDFNSWTLPVTVSSDDFLSLDTAQAYAPRLADGSLPPMTLARLREDSDLVDRGEDVGLPFAGAAPDLGAFEVGLEQVPAPGDAGVADAGPAPDTDAGTGVGGPDAGIAVGGTGGAGPAGAPGGAGGVAGAGAGPTTPPPATSGAGAGAAGTGPFGAQAGAGGPAAAAGSDAEASGCSCRVTPSPNSTGWPALLVAMLIGVCLRARRRRRARTLRVAGCVALCLLAWGCSEGDGGGNGAAGQAGSFSPASGGAGAAPSGGAGGAAGADAAGAAAAGSAATGGDAGGAPTAPPSTGGVGVDAGGSGGTGGTMPAADAAVPPDAAVADAGGPDPDDPNALFVAVDGSDANPGTQALPLATLPGALEHAAPGSTIWIGPGTYAHAATIRLDIVGDEASPIRIFAVPGERPVLDFSSQTPGDSSARGLQISGSYFHLRGIDVMNAGDNCIHISGAHNTVEHVATHGCSDTGIQITANGSEAGDPTRAAYNTILNCDSYENYDAANQGENADGFAAKLYIGPGNVFRGCRAWNNADDGWDLFASDDVVVIEDCWAIANGKIGPGQDNTNGDGNGFKLGGAARLGDLNMGGAVHQVRNCISLDNQSCGFTRNNNTEAPELSMCGGSGDGRGTFCSLTSSGDVTVQTTAAEVLAAERDADGNLPPL